MRPESAHGNRGAAKLDRAGCRSKIDRPDRPFAPPRRGRSERCHWRERMVRDFAKRYWVAIRAGCRWPGAVLDRFRVGVGRYTWLGRIEPGSTDPAGRDGRGGAGGNLRDAIRVTRPWDAINQRHS